MANGEGILSLGVQDSLQQYFGAENMPHLISAQAFSCLLSLLLPAPFASYSG